MYLVVKAIRPGTVTTFDVFFTSSSKMALFHSTADRVVLVKVEVYFLLTSLIAVVF